MACAACEERRRILAEAKKRGTVAVIKALPKVGAHILKYRPRDKK